MNLGKRIVLRAIAGSLCVTAVFAIAILLFSSFGDTQARILGTTGLIAAYGLLALPAGILIDQGRLLRLAGAGITLTFAGFVLAVIEVWTPDPPAQLGKALMSVTAFALASTQTTALAARRDDRDPASVRWLFAASLALAAVLAFMVAVAVWAEVNNQVYFRVLAALAVADVLTASLQPILARLRVGRRTGGYRLRLLVDSHELELEVSAPTFATAVARAIASMERRGESVLRIERVDGSAAALDVNESEGRPEPAGEDEARDGGVGSTGPRGDG